ncbi:alpha/beta fold hydrolase [Nocardia sp. NPDC127526]|uniref:alpha/beta fold hydrolase n=1 Tax=Nocardia sp. NPDC127526 TaxID=3345393 RepID=UPI0036320C16
MEQFRFEGIRVAYMRRGESGPPVVLLHQAGGSHLIWMPQITALARKYRVHALDLPGYGASDKPAGGYGLELYVNTVRQFLRWNELTDVALVGNCVGAATSLTLARRYPAMVRAVVAINPLTESTAMQGEQGLPARLTRGMPALGVRAVQRVHTPKWLARSAMRYWFSSRRAFRESPYVGALSAGFPVRALTGLVRDLDSFAALDEWPDRAALPPVCTIWGTRNRVLSAAAGRALNEKLRPERAEWLDGCGHVPMLERHAEVTAIIDEFLTAHPVPAHPAGHGSDRES